MESIDFFHGTRVQPPLVIPFYDGKAELECTISEGWGQLILHSLRCGDKYVRKLKRSIGMVYTEKDDLESLVSGSLGLKGIASLDSQISSKIGVELQLSRSEEIEDEFTFEAPTCGERIVGLYQLRRNITLRFRDNRLFHKKEWSMSTTYWADRIHDNSHMMPVIPECGCEDNSSQPRDGRIYVDMGNVTMTTDFIENTDTLRIPELDIEINKSALYSPVQMHKSKLPKYLLFLAGELPETINVKLSLSKIAINDAENYSQPYFVFDSNKEFSSHQSDVWLNQLSNLFYKEFYSKSYISGSSLRGYIRSIAERYFSEAIGLEDESARIRALSAVTPRLIDEMKIAMDIKQLETLQVFLKEKVEEDETRKKLNSSNDDSETD